MGSSTQLHATLLCRRTNEKTEHSISALYLQAFHGDCRSKPQPVSHIRTIDVQYLHDNFGRMEAD
jgi:hypothetical protein